MIDKTPYTPGTREVLKLAKAEAGRLGNDYIGPEHYLLGIIRKGDGLANQALAKLDVDPNVLKNEVEQAIENGEGSSTGIFSQNADAKRALEGAKQIGATLKHGWVGTEHLLLGIIHTNDTIPARSLMKLGVDFETAHREVLHVIAGSSPAPSNGGTIPDPPLPSFSENKPARAATSVTVFAPSSSSTPAYRAVLYTAAAEAAERGSKTIGAEHLLFALIRFQDDLTFNAFRRLGAEPDQIKTILECTLEFGAKPFMGPFTMSAEAKRVIDNAEKSAKERKGRHDLKDLFFALIETENTLASKCLSEDFGIDTERLKEQGLTFDSWNAPDSVEGDLD